MEVWLHRARGVSISDCASVLHTQCLEAWKVWPRTQPSLVERFVVETLERSLGEYVRIRPRRSPAWLDLGSGFRSHPHL